MKKILSILAAISFTAGVSSTVVACGTTTSNSSSASKATGIDWGNSDEVLLTLADGTKVTVGDLIGKNTTQLDDYLMNYVNGLVADKYTSDYADNTLVGKSNLGFMDLNNTYKLQNAKTKINAYSDEVNSFGMIASALDLYRQYVAALISDGTTLTLDQQYIRRDHLNPVWYKTAKNGTNGRYSLWYQAKAGDPIKRWTTISETGLTSKDPEYKDVLDNTYLPKADELNTGKFFLVSDDNDKPVIGTGWDENDLIQTGQKLSYASVDELKAAKLTIRDDSLSGQQALLLRYQAHVQSTSTDSMLNALVMEYAKNNLYKMQSMPKTGDVSPLEKATNKSLYIDTSSTAARDIQSWPSASDNLVTSNYKMVWTLTLPKTALDGDTASKLQSDILGLVQPRPLNSKLKSNDYALLKNDTPKTISSAMDKLMTDAGGDKKNLSKNGSDPYFGISGYQGIVKDGKSVDGGTLNIDSTAVDKIKNVEGMGILSNGTDASGSTSYAFANKDDPNENVDLVFVMPLYLMDLLRNGSVKPAEAPKADATHLYDIALNQWIELNPQTADAKWSSSSDFKGSTIGGKTIPYVTEDDTKDDLPAKTSLLTSNGKTYIFIPTQDSSAKDITLTPKGQAPVIVAPENTADAADATKNDSAYGVQGIFESTDQSSADAKAAWQYNGQRTNYAIHLGIDNSNPQSYEKAWKSSSFQEENVPDVANLSYSAKNDLMNTLFASIAKNDTALQEETKNAIYRNYISLDDIKYKGLYDKIDKYLKEDDKTDPSD